MYGLDIEGLFTGELSVIRAARLTAELPRGSQIWVALGGGKSVTAEWELLNAIEYHGRSLLWQNGDPKKAGKAPEPMPYPEVNAKYASTPQKKKSSEYVSDRAAARAKQLREKHRSEG